MFIAGNIRSVDGGGVIKPTRTKETIKRYQEVGRSIMGRYRRDTSMIWQDDPFAFVAYIQKRTEEWRPSTWNLYKQGILMILKNEMAPVEVSHLIDATHIKTDRERYADGKAKPRKKDGSESLLYIDDGIVDQYMELLKVSKSQMADLAIMFILVNREIGLRPVEWGGAYLDGNRLFIRNAKNTNGRSTGDFREMILSQELVGMTKHAFALRDLWIDEHDDWGEVQGKLKIFLRNFRRNHSLPRMTMYSTRHQFAANAKSALSQREVADALGHISDKTAGRHYGKRRKGRGSVGIKPVTSLKTRTRLQEMENTLAQKGNGAPKDSSE